MPSYIMSQTSSLPLAVQASLAPVWAALDSVAIVPSSTNNDALLSQFQLRLFLARLRLSRWAVCLASSGAAADGDPACQASAELLTDLGAELERVGYNAQLSHYSSSSSSSSSPRKSGRSGKSSGSIPDKVNKVVSSRAAQLSIPVTPAATQIVLSTAENNDVDFLLGWTSSTLTSLEGLLTTSARKTGRDLCAKEAGVITAAGDEASRTDAVAAIGTEVREHRDAFLSAAVGGGV